MFVTIINDCSDDNVMSRQQTRAAAFFCAPTAVVRVNNDVEAAGNIIDTLDAAEDTEGIILANVAPRSGKSHKWPNGTPFGYFTYKNITVGATIDGYTLSLVKKFQLADVVFVFDIPTVMDAVISKKLLAPHYKNYISASQFRSFDFLPRVIKWVHEGVAVPSVAHPLVEFPDIEDASWWIDNFGNAKTSLLPKDISHKDGAVLQTAFGQIACYNQLRNVPDKEAGLVIGSSGLGDKRFVELVVQGASAAARFNLHTGDALMHKAHLEVLKAGILKDES